MGFKALSPNWSKDVQDQLIDQSINEKPDMILLIPLDAKGAVQQARKINAAGIPLQCSTPCPKPRRSTIHSAGPGRMTSASSASLPARGPMSS